jgi:hypothetical protein
VKKASAVVDISLLVSINNDSSDGIYVVIIKLEQVM